MQSRLVKKVTNQNELQEACLDIFTKNKTYVKTDHGEIILYLHVIGNAVAASPRRNSIGAKSSTVITAL